LAKHGYRLSPGTLYPVLHTLEEGGWLTSEKRVVDGKIRKYYQLTPAGRETLIQGREKVEVLLRELRE
jgi:DNA-binding PadR family transcriptional regulator